MGHAPAATLTAGPGQQYKTIAAAVAASRDGDTINVRPGVYVNDFAEIATKITLQAGGSGKVHLIATEKIPNEKAILITDTDITINGFEFSSASVTFNQGENGAGIRYQGGNLVLNDCYFHGNQEGLLAASDSTGTITVNHSEFKDNGDKFGPATGKTHNIYVNYIATLDIEDSYFHGANVGHEIKSRAATTIVRNTRVVDGPSGTASYSIDAPNGGVVTIENDQIEQGPATQNPIIVSYGEEGVLYSTNRLTIANTLIENDLNSGNALALHNVSSVVAAFTNDSIFGLNSSQVSVGPAAIAGMTYLTAEPAISVKSPW